MYHEHGDTPFGNAQEKLLDRLFAALFQDRENVGLIILVGGDDDDKILMSFLEGDFIDSDDI